MSSSQHYSSIEGAIASSQNSFASKASFQSSNSQHSYVQQFQDIVQSLIDVFQIAKGKETLVSLNQFYQALANQQIVDTMTLRQVVSFIRQNNTKPLQFAEIVKIVYVCTQQSYWKNNINLMLFFWAVPFYDRLAHKRTLCNVIKRYYDYYDLDEIQLLFDEAEEGEWVDLTTAKGIIGRIKR